MKIPCPTCGSEVELKSQPIRGPAGDGSDAWVCLKCPAIVCIDCYHQHSQQKHPEMKQEQKKPKKK